MTTEYFLVLQRLLDGGKLNCRLTNALYNFFSKDTLFLMNFYELKRVLDFKIHTARTLFLVQIYVLLNQLTLDHNRFYKLNALIYS